MNPTVSSTDMTWEVTPFYDTLDGTRVFGTTGSYSATNNTGE